MQTHDLKRKTPLHKSKWIGHGGKRGKTSGRGGKGQTARTGSKLRPEMREFIEKIPKLRGRGVNVNTPVSERPVPINLTIINEKFKDGDKVTPSTLAKAGIVSLMKGKRSKVKILATGEITKKITVAECLVSESAKAKILKAGGKVLGK
jgi:large subunit ribosomal protein L15